MSISGAGKVPVAVAIANLLVESGVRRAYTVPGESFLPLLEAFDQHPEIQVISARHEGGAAFMAEADGKLSGVPAVVMATRGVGAANLSIGLHTARQDGTPMLALLGQVETEFLGNEAFQEVDLPKFLSEVSVWGATVHRSDRAAETVARGLVRATSGRRGPAVVAFPADVLEGECAPQPRLLTEVKGGPRGEDLRHVVTMLRAARRAVVIAGAGNDHEALVELATRFGLGVYSAFRRQDQFPNANEHYLGHLSLGTPQAALTALAEADLVLVLGDRLDETTTQGYSLPLDTAKLIHVHPDPAILGSHQRTDLAIVADPALTCASILALDAELAGSSSEHGGDKDPWWKAGHQVYLDLAIAASAPVEGRGLHPGLAVDAVRKFAAPRTVVVNDAGNFSVYLHRQWVFSEAGTQAAPISGAMGYAVPGAVGASLARADRPVLAVAGDGGFLMTCTELETSVRLGLNIKVLVLQNGLYGTIAMHQAASGRAVSASDISTVDIAGIARALGAHAFECFDKESLAGVAEAFMSQQGTSVMVVHTDPDIIAPGRSLSAMLGARK
jgi:acetolactate synthase-1/2/3 large subunit